MRPWEAELAGSVETLEIDSAALEDNPLGDRATRPVLVYLPPSYRDALDKRYPVVYVLQGFGSAVPSWLHPASTFELTYPESADALFMSRAAPECLIAFVDAWTSLGGSQFLDSTAVGRYHTYLVDDVVTFVDGRFRTLASPAHRAVQGKSSGGYGALVTAMKRPDVFGAVAAHSADGCFELSMLPLIAAAYRALRDEYDSDYVAWWEDFRSRRAFSRPTDGPLLECYALSACYSPGLAPGTEHTVELPFDPTTGQIRKDVFARWCELDPVAMAPSHLDALASLGAIWIDCGRSDEHFLDVAADQLAAVLSKAGIEHHHELFAGGHRRTEHRYPLALAYLAKRLAPVT
ncbi:MAG: alpha/beta hydrolase [Acidimicrobiales bacterium]